MKHRAGRYCPRDTFQSTARAQDTRYGYDESGEVGDLDGDGGNELVGSPDHGIGQLDEGTEGDPDKQDAHNRAGICVFGTEQQDRHFGGEPRQC